MVMMVIKQEADDSFTARSEALSGVVERLRQEVLPLEESLALFEAGLGHAVACQQFLQQAKGRFETLQEAFERAGLSGGLGDTEAGVMAPTLPPELPEDCPF